MVAGLEHQINARQSESIDSGFFFSPFFPFCASPRTYLVPGMADRGVSLHCYAECEVDGARHGDLSHGQNHTHQGEVSRVGQQARNSVFNGFGKKSFLGERSISELFLHAIENHY